MSIRDIDFSPEWNFRTSRSSGKGGQNVNKLETRVELYFNIADSQLLSEEQKLLIASKLAGRINQEGYLQITSEKERSQLKNKLNAITKFYDLLERSLFVQKSRKASRPSRGAIERRLSAKRINSSRKENRRRGFDAGE
jgi:ribosome-associated protein